MGAWCHLCVSSGFPWVKVSSCQVKNRAVQLGKVQWLTLHAAQEGCRGGRVESLADATYRCAGHAARAVAAATACDTGVARSFWVREAQRSSCSMSALGRVVCRALRVMDRTRGSPLESSASASASGATRGVWDAYDRGSPAGRLLHTLYSKDPSGKRTGQVLSNVNRAEVTRRVLKGSIVPNQVSEALTRAP
jgi:hypothetical protein